MVLISSTPVDSQLGFGPASETMARNYYSHINKMQVSHKLPLDSILVGSSRTRSSSSLVTDSAAGATAFSCARKSYNAAISVVNSLVSQLRADYQRIRIVALAEQSWKRQSRRDIILDLLRLQGLLTVTTFILSRSLTLLQQPRLVLQPTLSIEIWKI